MQRNEMITPNYLVITALGENKPHLISVITDTINKCACHIVTSKFTSLGKEFAMNLLVSGNWSNIAKLEAVLNNVEKKLHLTILQKRTTIPTTIDKINYIIQAFTVDQPGIIHNLASFFIKKNIEVDYTSSNSFSTNAKVNMIDLTIKVKIPTKTNIPTLRDQFLSLCETLGIDVSFEPQYF